MTKWRETTPESVQREVDSLVRVALGVAQQRLSTNGSLQHGLVTSDLDGNLEVEREEPLAPSESLTGRLHRTPEQFRAAAVISTQRDSGAELVTIHVEHCEGVALELTARCEVVGLNGEVAMGRVSSTEAELQVWAADLLKAV